MNNLLIISSTILTTILILKLKKQTMVTFADFQAEFDKQNAAFDDIKADLDFLKSQVEASGLTGAEEDALLAAIQGVTSKVEALSTETTQPVIEEPTEPEIPTEPETPVEPEVPSPENPSPEELI